MHTLHNKARSYFWSPLTDCFWGLCHTAEPEMNHLHLSSEYFTHLLLSPRMLSLTTHFYPLSRFTFHCHPLFCHFLSCSHSAFMSLYIISTTLLLSSFPLFVLIFNLFLSVASRFKTFLNASLSQYLCACMPLSCMSSVFLS